MTGQTTDEQLGRLAPSGTHWQLIFERSMAHPATRVWRALTEPDQLAVWFPSLIEGTWSPGEPLTFRFAAGRSPEFTGDVLVVDPPHVLEFRWGPDRLRFCVQPTADGEGCTLILTVTFAELGRAARDAAGWQVCLNALASGLDGGGPAARPELVTESSSFWAAAIARYAERFGPQAATIGPPSGA
jgi:uncharacterized protein YndB with AHSA1/START domain